MRIAIVVVLVAALAVLGWMSFFTVDPTEYVYVTEFGRHVGTYDGSLTDTDAGLHWRWPWPVQSVRRLDRRLQHFDLPAIEVLTREADAGDRGSGIDKTLTVEAYVCWRIADKDAVDRFVRRIDTLERAKSLLGQRVNGQLGALLGQMRMDDLVSTKMLEVKGGPAGGVSEVDRNLEDLRKRLLDSLRDKVREEYGIEIVDIRLKRFNHPVKVRDSIFARIISERRQISARYESEGDKLAKDIRSVSQAKVELLTRYAENVEKQAKADADRQAALIAQAAYEQDIKFFLYWNELEQMKALLGSSRTKLLLATQNPMLRFLDGPSRLNVGPAVGPQGTRTPDEHWFNGTGLAGQEAP